MARIAETGMIESGTAGRRLGWLPVGSWLLAAAGLVLAYGPTMATLWRIWRHNPNYSHGILIPPVALWLVWRQRAAIAADAAPSGSWRGLILLVPAAVLQVIGIRGDVAAVQGASLLLALGGLAWELLGGRAFRRCLFPIAFLIFMVPTAPWFMNTFSFRLKILAARGAVGVAHALGVAVVRDGVNLIFPGGVLAVENACSGLRSLIALLSLGALFAYFSDGALWKRATLFVVALPIAVFANVLRVSALCGYAALAGVGAAAGTFHTVGGYALFAVAFLVLAACKRALRC